METEARERDQRIADLQAEITIRDTDIAVAQGKVDDLAGRLAKTLQLDASANNQELATLRTDLSKALKLEHQDFQEARDKAFSDDQYEAFKASLTRIFKTLKRFNITFE
jgi:hypothetical protein